MVGAGRLSRLLAQAVHKAALLGGCWRLQLLPAFAVSCHKAGILVQSLTAALDVPALAAHLRQHRSYCLWLKVRCPKSFHFLMDEQVNNFI